MTIAGFVEPGASVVDVGTDHGYLPVYLAQNGLADSIIASDMSVGSLDKARLSATKYGVSDKITFITAPGLSGIDGSNTDTVIIAGLGGETIAEILAGAQWTKRRDIKLIVQPQSKIREFCVFLRESGYSIRNAQLANDNDRLYVVILACGGSSDSILEPELELLTRLIFRRDPLLAGYLDDLITKTRRELDGMKKSSVPDMLDVALRLSVYVSLKEEYNKCQL